MKKLVFVVTPQPEVVRRQPDGVGVGLVSPQDAVVTLLKRPLHFSSVVPDAGWVTRDHISITLIWELYKGGKPKLIGTTSTIKNIKINVKEMLSET